MLTEAVYRRSNRRLPREGRSSAQRARAACDHGQRMATRPPTIERSPVSRDHTRSARSPTSDADSTSGQPLGSEPLPERPRLLRPLVVEPDVRAAGMSAGRAPFRPAMADANDLSRCCIRSVGRPGLRRMHSVCPPRRRGIRYAGGVIRVTCRRIRPVGPSRTRSRWGARSPLGRTHVDAASTADKRV
jgi:hypothetical protein